MREEEKPFVCVKGKGSFNITPRNATGWLYTAMWLVPALALALGFAWLMEGGDGDQQDSVIALVGFILIMTLWAVAMTRWMYVRSEVIDLRKLTDDERRRGRGKP